MQNNSSEIGPLKDDSFNIREALNIYLYHWKWFIVSVAITVTLAILYLLITPKKYQVASAILITALEGEGGANNESSAFGDLVLFDGPKNSLDTEISILKSIKLLEEVVHELDLNITYQTEKYGVKKELYSSEVPFNINLLIKDSILNQLSYQFSIKATSSTTFVLFNIDGDTMKEGAFGEKISLEHGELVVTPSIVPDIELYRKLFINISPVEDVAMNLQSRIKIAPETRKSNLLILTFVDPIRLKAQNILNTLVSYYNQDAVQYKTEVAYNTDEFINQRITDISAELTGFDRGVETYKKRNKLSDIDSEAGITLTSNAGLGNEIIELTTQIKLIDYISEYMKSNKDKLIPGNLGTMSPNFSENIISYNKLLVERNNLLRSASEDNPIVTNLNGQLVRLRESIDQSLYNTKLSLTFSLDEAKKEEIKLASKISASPKIEREIKDIQRQQEIVETLYLYLLQKKEENSISLAITSPNAKIIDKAYGSNRPVSPRKLIVLFIAVLFGALFPVVFIFIRTLLDNKIHLLEDIEQVISGGVMLGDLPNTKSADKLISFEHNNALTESFRLLRTNVDYLLRNKNNGKVIFITSTIAGEGKTFVALNLATAFSLSIKKCVNPFSCFTFK